MTYRVASTLLLLFAVFSLAGCDKATPVAPDGTVLIVSANPSKVSLNGSSTITIVGRRPDGNPLNPGTEIRLSVDRGTIDSIVSVDSNGRATATYRADGRSGVAKITAATGGGTVMSTTDVQVGESAETKPTVLVSASPNNVAANATSTVTVIARNSDGTPLAGVPVILTTTLGTLNPNRPTTRADGTATATLQVGPQAGTATVTAIVGSSEAATTTVTVRDAPSALTLIPASTTIPASGTDITWTASVTNSTGDPASGVLVTFNSIGTFENGVTAFTDANGIATKKITYSQEQLNGVDSFTVTATAGSATDTSTVTVVR